VAKKPFSQSLYDNDDNAKEQIVKWLNSQGWNAWVNPDQYGIDILSTDPLGLEHKFEVEIKHNWKGPVFKYSTLHYSERKRKFLTTPENTSFVTLNHERTHILLVPGRVLSEAPTIIKDTIYTKGEKFIEVSVSDCSLEDLKEFAMNRHSAEWLQARSELVAILVRNGIIATQNDIAGFPAVDSDGNETWISIYDLMEK
jgi:hypothetical protein